VRPEVFRQIAVHDVCLSMPIYHYQVAFADDQPLTYVANLPTVEAATPFEAVDVLRHEGRLPNSESPIYVRVVTSVHENGMPFKAISVPLVPLKTHVDFARQ
jgi:hypothetical protein